MLGLPDGITACLFDLDGGLTKTAVVHERAWKTMFDEFLGDRGTFEESDYNDYVDGKPRYDGVRSFLVARGIDLRTAEIRALGDRKDGYFGELLSRDGVRVFGGTVRLVDALAGSGIAPPGVSLRSRRRPTFVAAQPPGHRGTGDQPADQLLDQRGLDQAGRKTVPVPGRHQRTQPGE